ncbi:hypothetical protein SDRG_15675 [Saprolegnia diclina VS20]|uniref:Uncharacterized protein n=1 Tax=Saprolegnia diclina (strain VS20) TaxID=1156394 RepID=T0RAF5_SAPDV|nr:hypothetical protein SDRG_15675 [Saprolegnia diclina VS20]EQC26497.1 hypothetical protein SDRG_15675 [Saprolegnia diclina VS20]|eukprot:XP_008620076.1 hypothetical protein SDRG_15675 [Saprolegnia diclina VS20]
MMDGPSLREDGRVECAPTKPRHAKAARSHTGGRIGNQQYSADADEMAVLQAENATLRQRLADMERVLAQVEQKQLADQAEALDDISELLKLAEMAKTEATSFNHNTARDKMRRDIQTLQAILKKAKAERNDFKKTIKQTEEKLRLEMEKKKEEGLKSEIDQEIFTRIIKEDREKYRAHVVELLARIKSLEKEKYDVFLWAKSHHEIYVQEMRKLARAFAKVKRMSDESTYEAKAFYHDVIQLKHVVLSDAAGLEDALLQQQAKDDDTRCAAFVLENHESS